jgi:hypothetical protein
MELIQNIGEIAASSSDLRALFHSFRSSFTLADCLQRPAPGAGRRALNKQSLAS